MVESTLVTYGPAGVIALAVYLLVKQSLERGFKVEIKADGPPRKSVLKSLRFYLPVFNPPKMRKSEGEFYTRIHRFVVESLLVVLLLHGAYKFLFWLLTSG